MEKYLISCLSCLLVHNWILNSKLAMYITVNHVQSIFCNTDWADVPAGSNKNQNKQFINFLIAIL